MKAMPPTAAGCWRPVVVSLDSSTRHSLVETLRLHLTVPDQQVFSQYPEAHRLLACAQVNDANLCLIDVSTDEDRALRLVRECAAARFLTIVALQAGRDPDQMLRCVRSGVHEFLSEPGGGEALWSILETLAERRLPNGPTQRGLVYVILPAKPNLGSTTVAMGLAVQAAREGSRSVLLAELDPLYGSLSVHLKKRGVPTFLDVFSHWERLDSDLWSQWVVHWAGVDVLLAPEGTGTSDFAAPTAFELLHFVRQQYSFSFLDCPGLLTDWYIQLAAAADGVLLVMTNEWLAVPAAQRCLTRLEVAGCDPAQVQLVVNRYQPEIGVEKQVLAEVLRRKVVHILPNDPAAAQQAVRESQPVDARSRLGKGLQELEVRLLGSSAQPPDPSFWSVLFSWAQRPRGVIKR